MVQLTKEQKTQLVALILILVGSGYVYTKFLLQPTLKRIDERKAQYTELVAKIKVAEEKSRRLPQLQDEFAQLQAQLATMEQQLPRDKDLPGILRTVTREALDEGLSFVSLKPNDPKRDPQNNFFDVMEYEIQMTGSMQSLVRFMSKLGQHERIFQFERLILVVQATGPEVVGTPQVTVSFTLKTYVYVG